MAVKWADRWLVDLRALSEAVLVQRVTELEALVVITWVLVIMEKIVDVVVIVVDVPNLANQPLPRSMAAAELAALDHAMLDPDVVIEMVVTAPEVPAIIGEPLPTRVIVSSAPRLKAPLHVFHVPPVLPSFAVFSWAAVLSTLI